VAKRATAGEEDMIHLIPLIVAGGIVKKFSDSMLGKPKQAKGKRGVKTAKVSYPSRYKPF